MMRKSWGSDSCEAWGLVFWNIVYKFAIYGLMSLHNIVTCMGYVLNNCGFWIRRIDLLDLHQ
jgi:hypothetical protein